MSSASYATASTRSVPHPAVLPHVLMLPHHQRASRIGEFFGDPRTQTFAQLLIDLEESPHSRAVVLG